jgi:uncharacterized membrane protein
MHKNRLEAFSDGVLAIVITVMLLEMKVPSGSSLGDLRPILPLFLSYVLSFVYVGIYWNNHHHMMHVASAVDGAVLWANLHLLFWLSLLPFVTGWMGENHFAALPTALYGGVLLCAAVAYSILAHALVAAGGPDSRLARALGRDRKGNVSIVMYVVGIALSFAAQWAAQLVYLAVALMWLIPDRRMTRVVEEHRG